MQNSHLNMTYAYHFLSEAIIIFLIALPIMHHHYFWVPYGSYLVIIIGSCIVFSLITHLTARYIWYLAMFPVLFALFYVLDYPLVPAILFSSLFVWRYIDIRKEEIIGRENKYILITLILTTVVLMTVRDGRVILYPFLQFVILIMGYIGSNLAVVQKEDRKQFDVKLSFYFVGLLAASAGIFYLLFNFLRGGLLKTWDGILILLTGALTGLTKVLSLFTVEKRGWPEQESAGGGQEGNEFFNKLEEFNVIDAMTPYWAIAIGILFLAVAFFFIIVLSKKRFQGSIDRLDETNESVTYNILDDKPKQSNRSMASLNKYFKKPKHPIRKLVYQFERKTASAKRGRKNTETIEEWIKRTGWNVDFDIYQKVRYGGQDVSSQEIEELKTQLKKIETYLDTGQT